jgi:hypothetical protein
MGAPVPARSVDVLEVKNLGVRSGDRQILSGLTFARS